MSKKSSKLALPPIEVSEKQVEDFTKNFSIDLMKLSNPEIYSSKKPEKLTPIERPPKTSYKTRKINAAKEYSKSITARNKINRFLRNVIKKRRTQKGKISNVENKARKTIGKFMRNTEFKRRSAFLNGPNVCNDSDFCMTFGIERKKIKGFFGNFQNLEFIRPPIQRVGVESKNGFIYKIHYKREKFNAYAILKSAAESKSDNLAYEYFVGKELNRFTSQFPHLVETYALYKYDKPEYWDFLKGARVAEKNVLFDSLQLISDKNDVTPEIISQSCANSKYMAVLIENVKKSNTFEQHLLSRATFWKNHAIFVLFQIYALLSTLQDEFTHYDLHASNVILYEPSLFQYIEYIYHTSPAEEDTIVIQSRYIAKIVDYGRAFIKGTNTIKQTTKSKEILDVVCNIKECTKKFLEKENRTICGANNGYGLLNPPNPKVLKKYHYINSSRVNQSHDLRLISVMKYFLNKTKYQIKNPELETFLNKLEVKYEGYAKNLSMGYPTRMNNVTDAFYLLRDIVSNPDFSHKNKHYYDKHGMSKFGTLHIYLYDNKSMHFEKG
jgi:hypothetical protein